MVNTPHEILFIWWNGREWYGRDMGHVWGRGNFRTGFWWENL